MKVLFVATVDIHIRSFHLPYLRYFKERGYEVHVACAAAPNCGEVQIPYCDKRHTIPFQRSPFHTDNLAAFWKLRRIIKSHSFAIIHCHTPVGGVVGRLAAIQTGAAKVLYTCHGFQFYKGSALRSWLVFYPVEWFMSFFTDVFITINQEDYRVSRGFWAKKKIRVNGVGVETAHIRKAAENIHPDPNAFTLVCVGELNKNKNQQFLLESMPALICQIPSIKLLLVGQDSSDGFHKELAERLAISDRVSFLGYRSDVPQVLAKADIAVSMSMREGLGMGVIEAMALGKPVVVSKNRGHIELVKDGVNGFIFEQGDAKRFIEAVVRLYADCALRKKMSAHAVKQAQKYDIQKTLLQMERIYTSLD